MQVDMECKLTLFLQALFAGLGISEDMVVKSWELIVEVKLVSKELVSSGDLISGEVDEYEVKGTGLLSSTAVCIVTH